MPYGLLFILGSILVLVFKDKPTIRKAITLVVPAVSFIAVVLTPKGIDFKMTLMSLNLVVMHTDKLSLFVGYIFTFIAFTGALYSLYNDDYRISIYGMLYIGASLGVVFAGDFITVYLFWELMALASTALIWCNRSKKAYWTGIRYIIMHLMGGGLFLVGMVINYVNTGSFLVGPVNQGLAGAFVFLGVGLNAAFIGLHSWLPESYPTAPIWASILMSVYTTKTAVYMLVRTSAGMPAVAWMGAIMAVVAVSFAVMQSNGRKLLSYHIVSQVGYMVAAIGVGNEMGINGGVLHLFNHILYKSLLFMSIGAALYVTGKEDLTELGGLRKKMPFTTIFVIIAAFSISGVPLFNGFTSKKLIFEAAATGGMVPIELLLELAAVGTFISFFKFVWFGFLRPNPENEAIAKEVPVPMRVAMGMVAALSIFVGLFPQIIAKLLPYVEEEPFYTVKTLQGPIQLLVVITIAFILFTKVFEPHKRTIMEFDRLYIGLGRLIPYVFRASQKIDDAFNYVYHRIIYIPELLSTVFDPVNNWLERVLESSEKLLDLAIKPIRYMNENLNTFLLIGWVDFWLYTPLSEPKISPYNGGNTPGLITRMLNRILKFGDTIGHRTSVTAALVEKKVVNGTGEQLSKILFSPDTVAPLMEFEHKVVDTLTGDFAAKAFYGNAISNVARLFDRIVIDGAINGVAAIVFFFGERARRIQTGLVQNYALIIIFIVSILIFILSIKGGYS